MAQKSRGWLRFRRFLDGIDRIGSNFCFPNFRADENFAPKKKFRADEKFSWRANERKNKRKKVFCRVTRRRNLIDGNKFHIAICAEPSSHPSIRRTTQSISFRRDLLTSNKRLNLSSRYCSSRPWRVQLLFCISKFADPKFAAETNFCRNKKSSNFLRSKSKQK